MTTAELLAIFRRSPLIASVQASPGSPVDDPSTLLRLAQASLEQGVSVLRLQGVENIRCIRQATGVPVIGLIKQDYADSNVYITPTFAEVQALLALGCEVIALDGTRASRPEGESLARLIELIHDGGALAMADCDSVESVQSALAAKADFIGTTLAGYTPSRPMTQGPDLELLREAVRLAPGRVIAEGRYAEPWQAQTAMAIGTVAVVVGGALNDPVKQTRAFSSAMSGSDESVGAVDIGGTWIRFGLMDAEGQLSQVIREPLPLGRAGRLDWISRAIKGSGVRRVGISTGGTVHPQGNTVVEAKSLIPDYVGTCFEFPGVEVRALNDGLATAWGHACHPDFAGLRVATLALGTGVGCGVVDRGRIIMGRGGEYPRLNDMPCSLGGTIEEWLGGGSRNLTPNPSPPAIAAREGSSEWQAGALVAAKEAVRLVQNLVHPDVVVVCGGVGMALELEGVVRSPYGADAGLVGAGMLVMRPPVG